MNPADRQRVLDATAAVVAAIKRMVDAGNLTRLHDAQPGLRAAAYDADHVSATGISDPTGRQAGQPDPTITALRNLDDNLVRGYRALDETRVILANWGPPRAATEADRLALQRANTKPEPFCESCARVSEPHGELPWLVPPWEGRGPTDVGGRLEKPMLLDRWCYTFVTGQGILPSIAQLEARRDGRRVLVKDQTPRRSA